MIKSSIKPNKPFFEKKIYVITNFEIGIDRTTDNKIKVEGQIALGKSKLLTLSNAQGMVKTDAI